MPPQQAVQTLRPSTRRRFLPTEPGNLDGHEAPGVEYVSDVGVDLHQPAPLGIAQLYRANTFRTRAMRFQRPVPMPTIFDNIDTHFLENPRGNGLRDALTLAHRGDFCVGYFNLRGWSRIDDVVQSWPAGGPDVPCRLLVGMQRLPSEELATLFSTEPVEERVDSKRVTQLRRQIAQDFRKQLTIGIPTGGDEAGLRRLARQLREGRLKVKLFLRHTLHAKLYLAHREDTFTPLLAYVGSSNLTLSGLRAQGELNVDILDQDAATKLHRWFEDRWADTRCLDITEELIAIIEESWAGERLIPPHHIYLKIAWHLSQDARDGIKEFRVPHDIAGELLPFQVKAVQLACRHLNKRGGVLVGDVVGLGKTRVACAIARVMGDDQMLECLILAPKNLVTMWENYAHQFGLRAPRVMSQTRALRELAQLPRYRLVVIDESHNFRNREGRIYQAIRDYLERNDCRVVLLSATPYNKTYLDLANQLRLFLPEQSDLGIRPESMLRLVGETEFSLQNPNVPLSSLAAFEKSEEPDDWREVMRLFLVRRTRSFIIQNYAETDERNSRKFLTLNNGIRAYFPQRVPRTVPFASDPTSPDDPCARLLRPEVLGIIEGLELPRYGLSGHLKQTLPPGLTAADLKIVDDLSRAGRRLMGFCKTNLFKRLESSGHAFLLSLHRHILRNYLFLHALENNLPLPIGQPDATTLDTRFGDEGEGELTFDSGDDESEDAEELPAFTAWDTTHYGAQAAALYQFLSDHQRRRYRWLRTDVFKKTLAIALRRDADALHGLLTSTGAIPPVADQKIQALISLVRTEHPTQKFLLFTQFADTAYYLERELKA